MSRGQAAMEFLVTYGWMIMVVTVTAGALYYFGFFNLDMYAPDRCEFGSDFKCLQSVIKTDATTRFQLRNDIGEDITLTKISCYFPNGVGHSHTIFSDPDWSAREIMNLSCGTGIMTFSEGVRQSIEVQVSYIKDGGFQKSVNGIVESKASA